ncbi:ribonuclease T2 [Roseiarcus fermentans]|uniref:Ribonuclease T2 n=1 Tax=Roseiarcus fermentans TaxID=1473586 RepID=A0A366FS21_9HYPH|nr:ribonuclease T2 [Roseiarcus fermentans]RBP17331.1 ribonuclease T2 [Roseiarcus fermentans]
MTRLAVAALVLVGLCAAASAARADEPPAATAPFDYYVLALSWSPGFCALGGERKSPRQCAPGAGYGFVVHGLWPDNRFGPDPEDCGDADVSDADLAAARGLYPTDGLAAYEYRKHGTCSGLAPADYFAAVRAARDGLAIPPQFQGVSAWTRMDPEAIRRAFIAANANMRPDNLAVTCARGQLVDVRVCLSKTLRAFAACPQVARNSCRRDSILVAPLR